MNCTKTFLVQNCIADVSSSICIRTILVYLGCTPIPRQLHLPASLCTPGVTAGRCSQIKHHYRPWKQHDDDDDDDDDHGDNDGDDGGEAIVR